VSREPSPENPPGNAKKRWSSFKKVWNAPSLTTIRSFLNKVWDTPYFEETWIKMWTSEYKPHFISVFYLFFAVIFITFSVLSHSAGDDLGLHTGFWGHIFHNAFFHLESYDLSLFDSCHPWKLEGAEIWEFWAIMLTSVFSMLLFWQQDEKPGVGLIIFCGLSIFLACPLALLFLGLHQTTLYQLSLLFMVSGLAIVDGLMFKASKGSAVEKWEYKFLQFFVDIPILISLFILIVYVRVQVSNSHKDFFSGALAFQFIMGCLLVLLVKGYGIISEDCKQNRSRRAPALLVLIIVDPAIQIYRIRKANKLKRANEAINTADPDAGGTGGAPAN
jgi:hypothetical protein